MPKPIDGETREEWMERCVPYLIDEGKDSYQAVAICSSIWEDKLIESIEIEDD